MSVTLLHFFPFIQNTPCHCLLQTGKISLMGQLQFYGGAMTESHHGFILSEVVSLEQDHCCLEGVNVLVEETDA